MVKITQVQVIITTLQCQFVCTKCVFIQKCLFSDAQGQVFEIPQSNKTIKSKSINKECHIISKSKISRQESLFIFV